MKKILGILALATLSVSSVNSVVSCGWTPSGNIPESNGDGEENTSNNGNDSGLVDILKTSKEELDVFGNSKESWQEIYDLYYEAKNKNWDVYSDLKNKIDQTNDPEEKENLTVFAYPTYIMYCWYYVISTEAEFYLNLYNNKIDVVYNNDTLLIENIKNNINENLLKNLQTNIVTIRQVISELQKTWKLWWETLEESENYNEEENAVEKDKWIYLLDTIMNNKSIRYYNIDQKLKE